MRLGTAPGTLDTSDTMTCLTDSFPPPVGWPKRRCPLAPWSPPPGPQLKKRWVPGGGSLRGLSMNAGPS